MSRYMFDQLQSVDSQTLTCLRAVMYYVETKFHLHVDHKFILAVLLMFRMFI